MNKYGFVALSVFLLGLSLVVAPGDYTCAAQWKGYQYSDDYNDCKEVSAMMQQHLEGSANHSHVLWTMMVFQAWHREWMEGGE